MYLDETIRQRYSTRMFLSEPVPRSLVEESLALATCAPSNSKSSPGSWCSPPEPSATGW
ncbi:nitroreductase family protein [Pseudonocardia alaniniphila]|uniref:nitroreductase family protein n=1 Tax=Pseudonocardia alaniniphila TaxID=75291 RepID=UPI003629F0CF